MRTHNELKLERRLRATPEQFETIIECMERYGDAVCCPNVGPQSRLRVDHLWLKLTEKLNNVPGGVQKSHDKWRKVWADWKTNTKKKAFHMRRRSPGGPLLPPRLNAIELRVLNVMKKSLAKKRGVEEQTSDPDETLEPAEQTIDDSVPSFEESTIFHKPTQIIVKSECIEEDLTREIVIEEIQEIADIQEVLHPLSPNPLQPEEPTPSTSSSTGLPRRRRYMPHDGIPSYLRLELRRLRFEEERDKRMHQREMERIKLDMQRIELQKSNSELLKSLVPVAENLTQMLQLSIAKNCSS